jgi:ATP-dependent protease HslVU (ClpYQ) peptidase subunit
VTIICGIHEPGVGTWIASDTLMTSGIETVGFVQKWLVRNNCALAISGSAAVLSIIADHLEFDASAKLTDLSKRIADLLSERGFKPDAKEGEPPYHGFSGLFATPESIVSFDSAGSVIARFIDGFAARGSGANYAEGAAWVYSRSGRKPRQILEGAVSAALAYCRGCGGELWIDCLRPAS